MQHADWTREERRVLARLDTPGKIQDFLNALPQNTSHEATCYSPRTVLRERSAHCVEGALLAAAALHYHGERALIVDLEATADDEDHVIAVFRRFGRWGAISKTNHAVLRYREPVYYSIRELVLSYFHEYFLNSSGKKTLRAFSKPVDLHRFDRQNWMRSEEDVWFVPEYLCDIPHTSILTRAQIAALRPADLIERKAGGITEW